jgi:CRP-like cAMP-binding protein
MTSMPVPFRCRDGHRSWRGCHAVLQIESTRGVILQPSEVLIRQDEAPDSVYVSVEGSLEICRQLDTAVLEIIDNPGSVIGEIVAMAGRSPN